jgi:GH18 family chitinase
MRKIVFLGILALTLLGCDAGNLGFYVYPQAAATGVSEERAVGPLAGLEVVGYLPSGKIAAFNPEQARHLTDLVYFTLSARADGTLRHDILTDAHRDFLRKVQKDYGVRILIGVTDHNRNGSLSTVSAQPELRVKFAVRLTEFLVNEGFNGADFDWEYPGAGAQDAYALLLEEIHSQFAPRGLRLSVAVSPGRPLVALAYAAVDRVHGMLYDDAGRHSTLENTADHVSGMVAQGVDPAKFLLGVPFYGRGYTNSGPDWSQAVSYKTLSARYRLAPNQDTVSGIYFNGIETIRRKVQYAKQAGLSGVMIWEIGQDSPGQNSLLSAITEERKDLAKLN